MCNLFSIGTDAEMWSLYSGAKSNLRDRVLVKGFPGGTSGKKKNPSASAGDARDMGSVPELGRAPGVGNSVDRGTWWATAHEVTKSWTQLSDQVPTHSHRKE